ncbi:MAG: lasso peptide biosynthesis B2 protein [Candidatus Eremiobacteraeota bacterium]|nr:lasso peptide biosynthesis B2 protein [Candidatus Eremiobacteraeota bacterium]
MLRIVRGPADVIFALRIGYFMWRLPGRLHDAHLQEFLHGLRALPRPPARDPLSSRERILRLRSLWLRLPLFRTRDNCYVRAMTLHRFLDAGGHKVTIHFGIEQRDDPRERLRGHAWVSVDGAFFEAPPEVRKARIREVPLPSLDLGP